jgi:predicted ATPase/transcriptional regulator with XRE-family HTH domain
MRGELMETSFGNWVKRRRKALDLTQHELAQRVGCSASLIFKIESDERRPSRQMGKLLAEYLDIPPDQRVQFLKVARQEKGTRGLEGIPRLSGLEAASVPNQPPGYLPIFPTQLIGREHEIEIVVKNLQDPSCRLLTLKGPGGIGKTRLAIEVAHRLKSNFPDGVFFLAMDGVGSPESLLPAIADGLGVVFSGPADPKLQLINYLRKRDILLVLDNFEHLLAGASLLGEILQQAQKVRMLLTSREPICLQWEWIFEVQGLPVPDDVNFSILETNSAIALFIQRARQTSQDFSLENEDASALVSICKLVDGLPLAIELAASWVRILSCREIVLELERSVDFLETSLHDVPARHRSIKSVFAYSWKLLTDDEREVLMKLAVFQGGFTRDAAGSVANASIQLLSSLVGKSLLRHVRKTDRYDLHELIRQYALVQLHERPIDEAQTLERFAQYYAHWLADRETALKSSQQVQVSASIRAETGNWHFVWQWVVQKQKLDLLRSMIPCLSWYFEVHGYYAEALSLAKFAVDELQGKGAPFNLSLPAEKTIFAFLVDQLAWFEFRTGNVERAELLFADALNLACDSHDQEVLYYIHGNWGYLASVKGDIAEAKRLTLESLANAQALNSDWHFAIPTNVLGIVDYQLGNSEGSFQQLTNSLKMWRVVGDPRGLTFCMLYLGVTALALGKVDTATSILNESNAIAKNKMDRWAQAFGLDVLGQVFVSQGQINEALDQFHQSLALSQEIGDQWGSTNALIHIGEAQAAIGFEENARNLLQQAYANAYQAKWALIILEVLVTYLFIDHETSPTEKLAATLTVLMHPVAAPHITVKAEHLRDNLILMLDEEQVEKAKIYAQEKSADVWAREILK